MPSKSKSMEQLHQNYPSDAIKRETYSNAPYISNAIYQTTSDQETEDTDDVLLNTPLLQHSKSEFKLRPHKPNSKYEMPSHYSYTPQIIDHTDYKQFDDRIRMTTDRYCNDRQVLLDTQECCSKKRIAKLHKVSKDYLDKNGHKMRTNVRQEFLEDFRSSVHQIRSKIHNDYSQKLNVLTESFQKEIKSELINYENNLKSQYKQQIEDVKAQLLSRRANDMKRIRDEHESNIQTMITKLRNQLELENEARLSHLQNIMEKERDAKLSNLKTTLQLTFETRYKHLREELARNEANERDMIDAAMKSQFDNQCTTLRQDNADNIEKYKMNLKNEYAQKLVHAKLRLTKQFDKEYHAMNNEMKDKMKMIHQNKVKEIEAENKIKLANQRKELHTLTEEKLDIVSKHCAEQYNKLFEANKMNAEAHFQKEKLELMESMDEEFKDKTATSIEKLREEFHEKHKDVLESYRHKLQLALESDIAKQKQILHDKRQREMDVLENKFKQQKKRWLDKINGAAVMDKRNALKKLHHKLEKEKNQSVSEICGKIQKEKQEAIDALKREHEHKKRRKIEEINDKYLKDPSFPDSLQLLEIKNEMSEEINLLERFEMFAQRIKTLQDQLKLIQKPPEMNVARTT
eukprot:279279_1